MGGKVVPKAGVPRVVWQRPREKGPIKKDDQVDHIPFLAVGRSLGKSHLIFVGLVSIMSLSLV